MRGAGALAGFVSKTPLPNDGTGIDGLYEDRGGSQIAYQVKYRKNHNLTFAEVAPFLGTTEKFTDRVIFTNASKLSDKAVVRNRWYSGEVFKALTAVQCEQCPSSYKLGQSATTAGSCSITIPALRRSWASRIAEPMSIVTLVVISTVLFAS